MLIMDENIDYAFSALSIDIIGKQSVLAIRSKSCALLTVLVKLLLRYNVGNTSGLQ